MDKIQGIDIPDNHIEFAKGLAQLAEKHGMDRVTVTYRPTWEHRIDGNMDKRINGMMTIAYSSVDGRGRSCRNLAINCNADFSLSIESNPESSS